VRVEDLLDRLEGVREVGPNKWQALCPAHDDHNPSLSIAVVDGKILLKCFAGCSVERICSRLGIEVKDLFLDSETHEEPEAIYDYHDEQGNLLYQVLRYPGHRFKQRRPTKWGWSYKVRGVRKVLYRLPEVLAAEQVFVVEGEKDADRLVKEGLVATTAPGGAGKWSPAYTAVLTGKDVVILPDNDPPGKEHGLRVARALYQRARSLRLVELPGLPEKGDVSDWLDAGHTLEELLELVRKTPEWAPPPEPQPELSGIRGTYLYRHPKYGLAITVRSVQLHSDGRLTGVLRIRNEATGTYIQGGSGVINLSAPRTRASLAQALEEEFPIGAWLYVLTDLYERIEAREREGEPWLTLKAKEPPPPRGWLVHPLLPQGDITILYGPGAAAKSLTGMLCSILVASGEGKAGPLEPQGHGEVLYLDWEDHADEAARRLWRLAKGLGVSEPQVRYRKCVAPLPDDLDAIQEAVLEFDAQLVIVDSLLPAAGAAEGRDPASVAQRLFEALRRLDTTCLVIAHHGKDKERGIYGSIFFRWLARNVWRAEPYCEAGQDELLVAFFHEKANRGRLERPWGLAFRFDGDEGPIQVRYSDPRANPNAVKDLPGKDQVLQALLDNGRMERKEIAEYTGLPGRDVSTYLRRLKKEGKVRQRGRGLWEAVAEIPPEAETSIQSETKRDEEVPF